MKVNPDFPASPCLMQQIGEDSYRANKPSDPKEWNVPNGGIPIKLHIATQLMQGFISAWGEHDVTDFSELAADSLKAADELIKQYNESVSKPENF